jgi:hypothetical protein
MTAKTAAAGQRWREKRRYSADQSWNSSPQVVNKPVTVWRPKQSKLLSARASARAATRCWSKAGRHWLQSCWKAERMPEEFFLA